MHSLIGPYYPNRPHSLPSHMGSSDPIRYDLCPCLGSHVAPFFPKNGTALGEPKPCCRACRTCISSQCLRRSLGNADGPSTAMGLTQILWPKKPKIDRRPKCWTLLHVWGKFMTWMSRTKGTSNYLLFFVGTIDYFPGFQGCLWNSCHKDLFFHNKHSNLKPRVPSLVSFRRGSSCFVCCISSSCCWYLASLARCTLKNCHTGPKELGSSIL